MLQPVEIAPGTTPSGFLAKPAVLTLTTFSDTTLWRRVRAGEFPAPVRISPGRVAWLAVDVYGWIRERSHQKAVA